jgi:hypothetical protein
VDFHGDTAEFFDTYFYKNYLESLRRPESPERRLTELHPSARTITLTACTPCSLASTPRGNYRSRTSG